MLKKFLLKISAYFLPIVLFYWGLYYTGYLPILSDSISYDAKIFETNRIKLGDVDMLAVGSSMTLYDVSSAVITQNTKLSYYNVAAWNLTANDIGNTIHEYVGLYHPRYVLLSLSFNDFDSPADESFPDLYISHVFPSYYYLKHFTDFRRLSERRKNFKERHNIHNFDRIIFDKNGGVEAIDTAKKAWTKTRQATMDNYIVKFPNEYAPGNYASLNAVAAFLKASKIKLIFVQPPFASDYLKNDTQRTKIAQHIIKCRTIIEKNAGLYLDYNTFKVCADNLFVDPMHLSGRGAAVLTRQLLKDIHGIVK